MSESKHFECPCKICLPILLIVLGVKLLAAELTGVKKTDGGNQNV